MAMTSVRHSTALSSLTADGLVRWAYVGDRPFTDIEAILIELDGLRAPSSRQCRSASYRLRG